MKKIATACLLFMLILTKTFTYSFATEDKNFKETSSVSKQTTPPKSNRVKTSSTPSLAPKDEKEDVNKNKKETTTDRKEENGDAFNSSGNPEVLSEAAILVNGNTGKVLFEKNSHAQMFPASTTKIMTAYLAIIHLDMAQQITVSESAVAIASDSSKMDLVAGEILTVKDLLYALMVQSANDVANALAEAVSGSIPEFVRLMNETAKELGMHNTQFANPHGYHDKNHYTTAYDMSLIAQKAMKNEIFAEIVATPSVKIPPTNKNDKERKYTTRNYMINPRSSLEYRYSYADGIKTGHTNAAGYCLVGSATRGGMSLISVVFKAPEETPERVYTDSKNMYEYAYGKYRIRTVQKGDELASTCNVKWAAGKQHLILKTNEDIKALLPRDDYIAELLSSKIQIAEDITAPIQEGTELGEIHYFYNNEEVASAKLYASREVRKSYIKQFFSYIFSFWLLAIFGIIVVFILLGRLKEKKRVTRLRRIKKQNLSKKR